MRPARPRSVRSGRGVAVAALVVVLALINVVVIGTIAAGSEESEDAISRVESTRAFYASESGTRVALRCLSAGLAPPASGSTTSIGPAKVRYVLVPSETGSGTIVVEGVSGSAVRRTRVVIDSQ